MGKISLGRVLVGGIIAGLVIMGANVAALQQLLFIMGVDMMTMPGLFTGWAHIVEFVLGGAIAWLYAAFRPRFGAGPRTGMLAGLVGWLLSYGFIWFEWVDRWPREMRWSIDVVTAWRLAGCVIGGWLAGWIYREQRDGGRKRG
jgi:hypothetical protein